jgi:hypothetical protein
MKKIKYLVNLQNARIQAEVFASNIIEAKKEAIKAFMINGFKENECKPELMFVKEA